MNWTSGLVVRLVVVGIGIVLLGAGLPAMDVDPHTEDSILLLYVLLFILYMSHYTAKHLDEILPDSEQDD